MTFLARLGGLFHRAPAPPPPRVSPSAPMPAPGLIAALAAMGVDKPRAELWAPPLAAAMAEFGISSLKNQACFLANILQETGNLTVLRENLNYSTDGLANTWPSRYSTGRKTDVDGNLRWEPNAEAVRLGRGIGKAADQVAIAESAYGGRLGNGAPGSGDGARYIGRGAIQITGKANYAQTAKAFGMPIADVAAWLETPAGAARASAHWWQVAGLNADGDRGDIDSCRAMANAGSRTMPRDKVLGLAEVREKYGRLVVLL